MPHDWFLSLKPNFNLLSSKSAVEVEDMRDHAEKAIGQICPKHFLSFMLSNPLEDRAFSAVELRWAGQSLVRLNRALEALRHDPQEMSGAHYNGFLELFLEKCSLNGEYWWILTESCSYQPFLFV